MYTQSNAVRTQVFCGTYHLYVCAISYILVGRFQLLLILENRLGHFKFVIWNLKHRPWHHTFEPRHDKTNKMSVHPAKTQISPGIRPVFAVLSVGILSAGISESLQEYFQLMFYSAYDCLCVKIKIELLKFSEFYCCSNTAWPAKMSRLHTDDRYHRTCF